MLAVPGSDYVLGGPVFWATTWLLLATVLLAAFIAVDALRRAYFPGVREAQPLRWFYVVPQAAYFVLMVLSAPRAIPGIVTAIVVLATPLVLAQGIAYLLRVVFPKPESPDSAEEFVLLADGGDTIEPESAPTNRG